MLTAMSVNNALCGSSPLTEHRAAYRKARGEAATTEGENQARAQVHHSTHSPTQSCGAANSVGCEAFPLGDAHCPRHIHVVVAYSRCSSEQNLQLVCSDNIANAARDRQREPVSVMKFPCWLRSARGGRISPPPLQQPSRRALPNAWGTGTHRASAAGAC